MGCCPQGQTHSEEGEPLTNQQDCSEPSDDDTAFVDETTVANASALATNSYDILLTVPDNETIGLLADIAELVDDAVTLAKNLDVAENYENYVKKIRSDYFGVCNATVSYRVLLKWIDSECKWKVLYDKEFAMDKERGQKFLQILKQETDKDVQGIVQQILNDKTIIEIDGDKVIEENRLPKITECIGREYWLFGIRLGVPEKKMQRMRIDSGNSCETHIKKILDFWKRNSNCPQTLITAMIKSNASKREVIECFIF